MNSSTLLFGGITVAEMLKNRNMSLQRSKRGVTKQNYVEKEACTLVKTAALQQKRKLKHGRRRSTGRCLRDSVDNILAGDTLSDDLAECRYPNAYCRQHSSAEIPGSQSADEALPLSP
jgi:hypothetical protein